MVLTIALNGALDLLWIPRHGAPGAAAATCLSLAAVNLLQTVEVWLIYRVHPFSSRSLVGALGTLVLAGLAWPWREGPGGALGWTVPLALFLLASALLYLVAGASAGERALLRSAVARLRR
jgi:O-antigen/teichoic acid export membrane protein